MNKVSFFAAAAAVTALVATPTLAQDTAKPRPAMQGKTDKQIKHMKHSSNQTKHMKHSARMQSRDGAYMRTASRDRLDNRGDWNNRGWDNRDTGFWPGNVVAGAVGTAGAVAATAAGTAGAIATAPFGGPYREGYRDTYAYGPEYADTYAYNGIAIPYSSNYAARNGFMCQPGTFIKGTRTLCQ